MRKALLVLFMLLGVSAFAQTAAEDHIQFVQHIYKAVVLLYSQTSNGGMTMLCTATSYRKIVDPKAPNAAMQTYRFVSAAHCVEGRTDAEQKATKYFLTADDTGTKAFIPATLIEAGDKTTGDDFSIFEVNTDHIFDVVPLGDNTKLSLGDPVLNVASPEGLGKLFFQGYISALDIDRPPLDAEVVTWKHILLADINVGPGSSGSALISENQHAIVGFVVGSFFSVNVGAIVLPVSEFKTFESLVDSGKYKKSHFGDQLADTPEPEQ